MSDSFIIVHALDLHKLNLLTFLLLKLTHTHIYTGDLFVTAHVLDSMKLTF